MSNGALGGSCADGEFCNFPLDAICGAADATGICEAIPLACTREFNPVCGCNDQTFSNACEANASGVAVASLGDASPAVQGLAALAGGTLAAGSHLTKAGTRAVVNTSPEPFSNIIVSTAEDIATGGLLALAIANPIAAAIIALGLVLLSLWLVFTARRALRNLIDRLNPPRTPAA